MYLAHDLFTMNYRSLIKCAAAENIVTQIDWTGFCSVYEVT